MIQTIKHKKKKRGSNGMVYPKRLSIINKSNKKKYLNKMGLDGWELVCIVDLSFGNSHMYYWKREI